MTLLDKALEIPVVERGTCSDEELDLLIAFVNGNINGVSVAIALGFTGPKRAQKAHNWVAAKLRHAIWMDLVTLQRR